jgi:hypothetical protein
VANLLLLGNLAIVEIEIHLDVGLLTVHEDVVVAELQIALIVNLRSCDISSCRLEVVRLLLFDVVTC